MAKFHFATSSPTKHELLLTWLAKQTWGPAPHTSTSIAASFHLEDPEGKVGMQVFFIATEGDTFICPLTYRDTPLDDESALVGTLQHSVLGTRWIYDGVHDPCLVMVLAAAALTGQGMALGWAKKEGRWMAWPESVQLHSGQRLSEPFAADRFQLVSDDRYVMLADDQWEMTLPRIGEPGVPTIGLAATWPGQDSPITFVTVNPRVPNQP